MIDNDPLLIRMHAQVDAWEKLDDHRYVFLRCYSMMTSNMLEAINQGRFSDQQWVDQLLHTFANYYFDGLDLYESKSKKAPAVWQQVHNASRQQQLHVLQDLLLGINAHINYDLVLAIYDAMSAEWHELSDEVRDMRMADHDLVNRIIGETIDSVQDLVIEREAPIMKVVDSLMGRVDEWLLSELITNWRTEVWKESCNMLSAENEETREAIRHSLEEKVLNKASQFLEY